MSAPTVADVVGHYEGLARCCFGRGDLLPLIVEVRHFEPSENDGPSGGAVVLLSDGKWAVFEEWQDYTGHGCQCGASASVHDTYADALRMGLSDAMRNMFGIPDPESDAFQLFAGSKP